RRSWIVITVGTVSARRCVVIGFDERPAVAGKANLLHDAARGKAARVGSLREGGWHVAPLQRAGLMSGGLIRGVRQTRAVDAVPQRVLAVNRWVRPFTSRPTGESTRSLAAQVSAIRFPVGITSGRRLRALASCRGAHDVLTVRVTARANYVRL